MHIVANPNLGLATKRLARLQAKKENPGVKESARE
jgi:hypothetical protein